MFKEDLTNFGYIIGDLPRELYLSLNEECKFAESHNKEFISGLTGLGVPKHYFVEKNKNELLNFIEITRLKYDEIYPNLSHIKILSNDLPFYYDKPWINIQKENEFIPNHTHDGIYSYTIWIKIPYNSDDKHTGNFEFTYLNTIGRLSNKIINLNKSFEGKIIMFPAKMQHVVWPFYNNKENRISISGNILLNAKGLN